MSDQLTAGESVVAGEALVAAYGGPTRDGKQYWTFYERDAYAQERPPWLFMLELVGEPTTDFIDALWRVYHIGLEHGEDAKAGEVRRALQLD